MIRFKVGERELKDVPVAGVLQAHSNILCVEGTVDFLGAPEIFRWKQ